ncbi:hypothetical protein VPHK479_0098 [Vibrio phage K479]
MFQIWLDAVQDYALINVPRGSYTWLAIHSEDDGYEFLEKEERSYYSVAESALLNKTGADAPDLVFAGTEDECISFVKALILIRS